MAGSITEHVIKLQELTQKNLEILQALNDSFFTNQNHLSVRVGENQYAIPSFISLENKLNSLTANFNNLVNAPESGEAFFNFDGNSRAIEVRSYTTTPSSLTLNPVQTFEVENNDIFKDFLTPNPYIHLDVQELPNDTTQVLVKKIIPLNSNLKQIFESNLIETVGEQKVSKKSAVYTYKDLYKILSQYIQDTDYIEYDTKIDLPVRKNIGTGTYVIEEILEDYIDDDLTNYIVIKLRSDLTSSNYVNSLKYRLFDETIERPLKVGDQLITFEGKAKMEITELRVSTNTIVVKVLNGEFLNLIPSGQVDESLLVDLNKLRFYSPINFDEDKYVKVPLEEDKYIFVAVAALNSRMNVQSAWGSGLMVDAHSLTNHSGDKDFNTYYKENVRNIGDTLFEITSMMKNTLTKYSVEEFNAFTQYQPEIDLNNLKVVRINEHLNNATSVQNIRKLYSQKKELQVQLNEIQSEITGLNEVLSTISFDDTTGRRTAYTNQITALTTQKNDINSSITKILDEIALAANNSEVPIENAKYRIRGHFDIPAEFEWRDHVKGIRVQYKYKNADTDGTNTVRSIDDVFTFTDWNEMTSHDIIPTPKYEAGRFMPDVPEDTANKNEISYNQIDIPISQGEVVEIRLKIVYDFGAPHVQTTSVWSPTVTIKFPEEYLRDIKILDIISENNSDIETNRFNNIIKDEGIPEHISDKITDQDMTYYHKPENIASGFYTSERRIIPLKDKLEDLHNTVTLLKDEIYGTNMESLKISLTNGSYQTILQPYIENKIFPEAYSTITSNVDGSGFAGNYEVMELAGAQIVTTIFNLTLTNDSDHPVKLFSMFPGDRGTILNTLVHSKYTRSDYHCGGGEANPQGVWIEYPIDETGDYRDFTSRKTQGCNQFLYFRVNDIHTGQLYYGAAHDNSTSVISYNKADMKYTGAPGVNGVRIYPKISNEYGLCIDSNIVGDYLIINPKNEIIIPIVVEYYVNDTSPVQLNRTIAFDILPSLYKDPISYKVKFIVKKEASTQDKILSNQQSISSGGSKYNPIYR